MNLSKTSSLQQVASLKPEVEFEVMKTILLRENYIQRLQKKLKELKSKNSIIDLSIIGLIDVLRESSIEVVEIIKTWEETQVEYPIIKPYLWNGQNYLSKITNDLYFLEDYPQVIEWLGFSSKNNPFLIPPDVLIPELQLDPNAYIVFGQRPPPPPPPKIPIKGKAKPIKSPYLTPIVNDADLIPSISAVNKFKANEEGKGRDTFKTKTGQTSEGDPFESYISASIVKRIRDSFDIICAVVPDFRNTSLSTFNGTSEAKSVPHYGEDAFSVDGGLSVIVEESNPNIVTLNENSSVKSFLNENKSIETTKNLPSYGTATIFANNSGVFENTSRSFHESMDKSEDIREVYNKSLRLTSIGSTISEGSTISMVSSASTKIWTPHEVVLQQVVKKKGGELFAITAAGGESRLKAPWRKTRFERLDKELNSMNEQVNMLQMYDEELYSKYCIVKQKILIMTKPKDIKMANKTILDLEREISYQKELTVREAYRYQLMKYSYEHFKKITDGSITNIEKLRKIQKLKDGQALEDDEKLSMSLEDIMAFKIQRQIRLKFGRAIRKALIRKLNRAATIIQSKYKYYVTRVRVARYFASVRLALVLQKLFFSRKGKDAARQATRSAQEQAAVRLLQRLYRGHLGRGAAFRRKEFMNSIVEANECVSLTKIGPGDIEDLTDQIAIFMDDYTVELPISLLSCLRVILYMFKGEAAEEIYVESGGIIEKKLIYAKTATWSSFKMILRRKSRFLRRLRQLANYIATPNPSPLPFTKSCAIACKNFLDNTKVSDFDIIEQGKDCALTLYEYAKCLSKVFLLQDDYPEYFHPGVPAWLRRCMVIRKSLDITDNERRIYESCLSQLSKRKSECLQRGKKYFAVAISQREIEEKYAATVTKLGEVNASLQKYVSKYIAEKTKDIVYLEEYRRAKEIGATVAQKDLESYIESSFAPDPKFIRELSIVCDIKKISLLNTDTEIEISKKDLERDKKTIDFDNIFNFNDMHAACRSLGIVIADLMVLREIWKVFLAKIGGAQFTRDLRGSNKRFYENLKYDVLELMSRRKVLTKAINDFLMKEINTSIEKYLASRRFINSRTWDWPSDAEKEAESVENTEIAKRDAEFAISMLKRTNRIFINPAPFMPVILCLDNRIPKFTLQSMIEKLSKLNFTLCKRKQSDCELTLEAQEIFDRDEHAMMIVDRGMHTVARGAFIGIINALYKSLVPTPRIVVLDGTLEFNFENWFTELRSDFHSLTSGSVEESAESAASLGALRSTASLITQCMFYKSNDEASAAGYLFEVPDSVRSTFFDDINSLINKDYEGKDSKLKDADIILTAVIAGILGFWNPPLTPWKDESFNFGSETFYANMKDLSTLSHHLLLNHPLDGYYSRLRMLTPVRYSSKLWNKLLELGFAVYPARYMLVKWCGYAITYLERVSVRGGTADENHRFYEVYYSHNLSWLKDVKSKDVDEVLGDIVKQVLKPCLVYENENCDIKLYYNRNREELMDSDKQAVILESAKSHSRVYYNGKDVYLGIDVNRINDSSRKKWTYFQTMKMPDMIRMLQPNGTEIYEGRVKKYNIGEKGTHKWYELLANWARLDDVGENFKVNALRARDLVTSRVGIVNGYMVRYEIYEERYGQILILIHGLIPGKAKIFNIGEEHIRKLLLHCDMFEEKGRIETLEALNIAAVFADRLEISPIKKWKEFLESGELCPKQLERPYRLRLRIKGGAGRFVGRVHVKVHRKDFVLSVYEISSYSEVWAIRVTIYDPISCFTVEYRISTLERASLFKLDKPLLQQIIERVKVVYCDINVKTRKLLPLGDNFKPSIGVFEVDGTAEFDILLGDKEVKKDINFFEAWEESPFLLESDLDNTNSNIPKYAWALYFDRSQIEEVRGNLTVNLNLSLYDKGFSIYVTDNRTLIQAYKLILYEDICGVLNKSMEVFEKFLVKVDETIVYNLVDDVMTIINISANDDNETEDKEEEIVSLSLVSSTEDVPSVPIISLRLRDEEQPVEESRKVITAVPRSRVDILIKSAEGLTLRGGVATRNAYVKIKWNKRELEPSPTVSRTVDPVWDYHVTCGTRKNQLLRDCTLDIEVFDSDPNLPKADFLGCVILTGNPLVNFLKADKLAQFSLIRAKNLTDNENTQVGGTITLQGQVDAMIPGFGPEIEKKRAMASSTIGRIFSRGSMYSGITNLFSREENKVSSRENPTPSGKETPSKGGGLLGGFFSTGKKTKSTEEEPGGNRARTVSFERTTKSQLKTIDTDKMIASMQGEDVSDSDASKPTTPGSKPTTPGPTPVPETTTTTPNTSEKRSYFGFRSTPKTADKAKPDSQKSTWSLGSGKKEEKGLSMDFLMADEDEKKDHDETNTTQSSSPHKGSRSRTATFTDAMVVSDTYSVDEEEEEEEEELLSEPQRIDVVIKSITNLNYTSPVVIKIRFNDILIGESAPRTEKDSKTNFRNWYCEMYVPPNQELSGCSLLVEVWDPKISICLGAILYKGSSLVSFIEKRQGQFLSLPLHPHISIAATPSSVVERKATIELCGDFGDAHPWPDHKLVLNIFSAKNLYKADTFGLSDPFVRVFFNDILVGETAVINDNLNPDWGDTERFEIAIPPGQDTSSATLELQVFDKDNLSIGDFLGSVTLVGNDFFEMMDGEKKDMNLQPNEKMKESENKNVKGTIQFRMEEVLSAEMVNTKTPTKSRERLKSNSSLSASIMDTQNDIVTFEFNVVSAKKLIRADTIGSSDPFVRIYFNGSIIGETACINNNLDPVWGDTEKYQVIAPKGLKVLDCKLEFELFDKDMFSIGDFLGCISFEGTELVKFIRGEIGDDTGDKVMSYKLQPSSKYPATQKKIASASSTLQLQVTSYDESRAVSTVGPGDIVLNLELLSINDIRDNLEQAQDVSIIIRWNGEEFRLFQPSTISKEIVKSKGEKVSFHNIVLFEKPFRFSVPTHYELKDCLLEIYVENKEKCIAYASIGKYDLGYLFQQHRNILIDTGGRIENALDVDSRPFSDIQSIPLEPPYQRGRTVDKKLILNIFSASDLYKADTFGLSDPFVRVFFNDILVGETAVINDNLNPDWGDTERFEIAIPPGQDTSSATLELQVFDKDNLSIGDFLGSVTLVGNDFFEMMDGERKELQLQPNEKMKESENKNVKGTITFGGDFTFSIGSIQIRAKMNKIKKKVAKKKVAYDRIETALDDETVGWRHIFTPSTPVRDPTKVNTPLVKDSKSKETEVSAEPTSKKSKVVTGKKFQLDLPGVKYIDSARGSVSEEDRSCWRGRAIPKKFLVNPEDEASLFISRSSRLVKTKLLKELKLFTDVKFLKEYGEKGVENVRELPVVVKEVVSDGPQIASRAYRLEVYSNSGLKLGAADIPDRQDLERVIGYHHSQSLLVGDEAKWDYQTIWRHIVHERLILDLTGGANEEVKKIEEEEKGSKSFFGSGKKEKESKIGNDLSVLAIMRDKPKEVSKKSQHKDKHHHHHHHHHHLIESKDDHHHHHHHHESKNDAETKDNEIDEVSSSSSSSSSGEPIQWCRIYTKTHRLAGRLLKTQVLLTAPIRDLYYDTANFFKSNTTINLLSKIDLVVKSIDHITKEAISFQMSGDEFLEWAPARLDIDLSTKFRRAKVGEFIVKFLALRYTAFGGIVLDLINREAGKLNKRGVGDLASLAMYGKRDRQYKEGEEKSEEKGNDNDENIDNDNNENSIDNDNNENFIDNDENIGDNNNDENIGDNNCEDNNIENNNYEENNENNPTD